MPQSTQNVFLFHLLPLATCKNSVNHEGAASLALELVS